MKKITQRSPREPSSLAIRLLGFGGAAVVVLLIAAFAMIPLLRQEAEPPGSPQTIMLAGTTYTAVEQVQPGGAYRVQVTTVEPPHFPPAVASLSMSGGGMRSSATVVPSAPGTYEITGTLPMKGHFDLTIAASNGETAMVSLVNK